MEFMNASVRGAAVMGIVLIAQPVALGQELLWTQQRDPWQDYFGVSLAITDDWSGDGLPELVIGSFGTDCGGGDDGNVEIRDSSNTSILLDWCGDRDRAGNVVVPVQDVDGDGKDDLMVACPFYDDPVGSVDVGRIVLVTSGAGGAVWELLGEAVDDRFGMPMVRLGDVDGDGFDEVLVASPFQGSLGRGRVYVISSVDGSVIRSHSGTTTNEKLGDTIAAITDVDGDGVADYAIRTEVSYDFSRGRIDVHSGASGALLWTKTGDKWQGLGAALCDAGDWNRDGHGDLLAWAGGGDGLLRIYSPATDQLLIEIAYQHLNNTPDMWGSVLTQAGDLDADGFIDFAVSAYEDGREATASGRVDLYSGRMMRPLYHLYPEKFLRREFGLATAGGRDFTGDGIPDLLVGAPLDRPTKPQGGVVFAYALNDLYLMAAPPDPIPGDTVVVDLRGGPPGLLGLMVLTDISGTPAFDPLLLAPFDANGELQLTADVDASVSGLDFTIRAWSQNRKGRGPLMDSIDVTVSIQ